MVCKRYTGYELYVIEGRLLSSILCVVYVWVFIILSFIFYLTCCIFSGERLEDHTLELASTSEKDYNHEVRSECLGSIGAVQDLMQLYSEMSDEEKVRS